MVTINPSHANAIHNGGSGTTGAYEDGYMTYWVYAYAVMVASWVEAPQNRGNTL